MSRLRLVAIVAVIFAAILAETGATAQQVPPHQPGTICFTPSFWCWMPYPGVPGQMCFCSTQWGPVRGTLG